MKVFQQHVFRVVLTNIRNSPIFQLTDIDLTYLPITDTDPILHLPLNQYLIISMKMNILWVLKCFKMNYNCKK